MNLSNNHPIFEKTLKYIYPCYIEKVQKKGRKKQEVDEVILWLTGYSQKELEEMLESEVSLKDFIDNAPKLNRARRKITGRICGIKVEEMKKGRMQELRYLDKLVDEIATGKEMKKILRK